MALHKDVTDPNLHEPKGASSAAVKTVYKADGAGSGAWEGLKHFVGGRLMFGAHGADGLFFQCFIPVRSKLSNIKFNKHTSDYLGSSTITVSRNGTTIATGSISNNPTLNNTVSITIPADTIFEADDEFKIQIPYSAVIKNASFGCYFQEV